jgi:hypothetical protein
MHFGLPIFTFTFNPIRELTRYLQNPITSNPVMIVAISLLYAWYVTRVEVLTVGETVKMGGSIGFTR